MTKMDNTIPPQDDPRRRDLIQVAVNSWGTSEILKIRAERYAFKLRASSLIGFVLPVMVGAIVIAMGSDWEYLKPSLIAVGIVSGIQAVYNAYLIFRGYEKEMQECLYSAAINRDLSSRAELLAKDVRMETVQFSEQAQKLLGENANQEQHDERRNISEKERRVAGRHGLFQLQRKCGVCKKVPTSLSAKSDMSNCRFCGNF